MGLSHLERLTRARELLAARGMDTSHCALACFSAVGFSDALRSEAARDDVLLIGTGCAKRGRPRHPRDLASAVRQPPQTRHVERSASHRPADSWPVGL
jgi:hypothetical protein